jgi:hypothetical protein
VAQAGGRAEPRLPKPTRPNRAIMTSCGGIRLHFVNGSWHHFSTIGLQFVGKINLFDRTVGGPEPSRFGMRFHTTFTTRNQVVKLPQNGALLPVLPIKLKKLSLDGYALVCHGCGPQNGPQLVRKTPVKLPHSGPI